MAGGKADAPWAAQVSGGQVNLGALAAAEAADVLICGPHSGPQPAGGLPGLRVQHSSANDPPAGYDSDPRQRMVRHARFVGWRNYAMPPGLAVVRKAFPRPIFLASSERVAA